MNRDIFENTAKALDRLCVPKKLSGYRYLQAAICMEIEEPGYIDKMTSKLYPDVAKKFSTVPSRTERCMRTAVESCFSICDDKVIEEVLGNIANPKTGKVSNSEFIAAVAKYVECMDHDASELQSGVGAR